eukprot:TRINITY_DN70095_c0_g1_i1.p1 TRINITY_DN70095_c0_g1~~TRINITY_DN70095_c0_g1_i1.p1  ORF type:complete len:332 (-),score=18.43 TRINITY_DN70095_c0_g1_i1:86-1081(-)
MARLAAWLFGLTASSVSGKWLRGGGNSSINATLDQLPFADPEAAALRQCSNGKRIIYVGDSTFRYEYLAMAYFMEHGKCYSGPNALKPDPSVEAEVMAHFRTFGSPIYPIAPGCVDGGGRAWEPFYRYTNSLLNNHETCDCFRDDADGRGTTATENRMYVSADNSVSVSYFQWFGETLSPRGTVNVFNKEIPCPPGQTPATSSRWMFDLPTFLSTIVRQLRPTHLIVSVAWWPFQSLHNDFWSKVAMAGAAAVSDTGGTVYWRTTPKPRQTVEPNNVLGTFGHLFQNAGWQLYPAAEVIDQLAGNVFTDGVHVTSEGNCNMIASFLKRICV